MRGRLIFPFLAEIARLDTASMVSNSDYDTVFREPKQTAPVSGQGPGTTKRRELAAVRLPAQVEIGSQGKANQGFSGTVLDGSVTLIFHMRDLEAASLVDSVTGDPLIRVSDRLVAVYDRSGSLVQTFRPTLYATTVQPIGYGLGLFSVSKRNLLMVVFEDREQRVP